MDIFSESNSSNIEFGIIIVIYKVKQLNTKNMTIYQLMNDKGNPARNQFVVVKDGKTYFQSYKTIIAEVNKDKVTLSKDWDFSNTTLKHLYIFLRSVGIGVYSKKDIEKGFKRGDFALQEEIFI